MAVSKTVSKIMMAGVLGAGMFMHTQDAAAQNAIEYKITGKPEQLGKNIVLVSGNTSVLNKCLCGTFEISGNDTVVVHKISADALRTMQDIINKAPTEANTRGLYLAGAAINDLNSMLQDKKKNGSLPSDAKVSFNAGIDLSDLPSKYEFENNLGRSALYLRPQY